MALPRRALLGSLGVAIVGCTRRDSPGSPGTEPSYTTCDAGLASTEELHTAGGIPDTLSEDRVREYVTALEKDIVLPPPDDRTSGYLDIGSVSVESVADGYLATVEVTGGYQREAPDGTATGTGTHADLGRHVATYFVNEQVVRRAVDYETELDPREQGEIVVCES